MLIRSQDKKSLFNSDRMENLQVNKDERGFCIAIYFTEDDIATMGAYSTEVKAIKVLDIIQEAYDERPFTLTSNGVIGNKFSQKVFQMPLDEEAEE